MLQPFVLSPINWHWFVDRSVFIRLRVELKYVRVFVSKKDSKLKTIEKLSFGKKRLFYNSHGLQIVQLNLLSKSFLTVITFTFVQNPRCSTCYYRLIAVILKPAVVSVSCQTFGRNKQSQ